MLEATLDAIPPIGRAAEGAAKQWPQKLHADKAYQGRPIREALEQRGIIPRIARPMIDSGKHLGRYRWVVERTFAWLDRFRRITIRYERRADIHLAFTTLAAALICLKQIQRFC